MSTSQDWTAPRPHAFREAYLDWSRLIGMRRDMLPPEHPGRGPEYAPIFIRLQTTVPPAEARAALLALVLDPASPLLMDSTELAFLRDRIASPDALDLPDEYMLYRRVGTPDSAHASLFEVLDSGMPVEIDTAGPLPDPPGPVPPSPKPGTPIVAIIDDGIGFLNARFCRTGPDGALRTRFHALWLQALEQHASRPVGAVSGRILSTGDIDGMLTEEDEAACYARTNGALFASGSRAGTARDTSHGTHVLDLAAGADPDDTGDPAGDWPLIGVQLPPETIDDTSGTWFESYLVLGLRWLLRVARQVDPTAPVIVNVSLGILAGPKDGTRFVEYQMTREVRSWEQATGTPVRLVWAFGNSYHSNQVARFGFDGGSATAQEIDWRAQPDDETASFVEIHLRGARSEALTVGLTGPDGRASGMVPVGPGEIRTLEDAKGAALARIYHVPERRCDDTTACAAHYVLALAPTRGQKADEPEAPAGAWRISLACSEQAEVLVQVQRDDAIRGGPVRGRQSYLDHPAAHGWDGTAAAYVAPGPGPITDAGCHSALVTAEARQVFSTGAARRSGPGPEQVIEAYRPAAYSAAGAPWSIEGPTAATVVGSGCFAGGVRAAGTLTGSTRRLGGTSAAAGRMSRALALSAATIMENAAKPGTRQIDDLDPARVRLVPTGGPDARLGETVVDLPESLPGC